MEPKKKKSQNLFLPFKFSSQLEIKRLFKNKCPADRWKVSSELFLSENQKFQQSQTSATLRKIGLKLGSGYHGRTLDQNINGRTLEQDDKHVFERSSIKSENSDFFRKLIRWY